MSADRQPTHPASERSSMSDVPELEMDAVALGHLVFEESCTEVDEGAVQRLARLLTQVREAEEDWWHKRWHQDTGIPCDGVSDYCPLIKRREVRP